MPENIRDLSLGEIITIPIEFEVIELAVNYNTVKLANDDLDLELYLYDTAYENLVQLVNGSMEETK